MSNDTRKDVGKYQTSIDGILAHPPEKNDAPVLGLEDIIKPLGRKRSEATYGEIKSPATRKRPTTYAAASPGTCGGLQQQGYGATLSACAKSIRSAVESTTTGA